MRLLTLNYPRAVSVFSTLADSYSRGTGLFIDNTTLVENNVPEGVTRGSQAHALFLFFTALNDHGVKSSIMYNRAKSLYKQSPHLFDPSWINSNFSENTCGNLKDLVSVPLGARYPSALAKSWYKNAVKLLKEYDGNPISLFSCSSDAQIVLKKIKEFSGIGPKIGGMILRASVTLCWTSDTLINLDKVLVPVDIHDSRIVFYTGILNIPNSDSTKQDYYQYHQTVQKVITEICASEKINWIDVDRALWLTGSLGCSTGNCTLCCINPFCSKSLLEK